VKKHPDFVHLNSGKVPYPMRLFPTLLTFITLVGLAGCSHPTASDPRALPQVVEATLPVPSARANTTFTGVVSARVQSDLGFRVSGKIIRRLVDTGQEVHVNQQLMLIDNVDYAHALTTQSQNVAAAKSRADQTAADEARYRKLVGTGAIAPSTYDQVKAAADAAQALLLAAQQQEEIARNQGDYSVLLADADGTVVETLAEQGQVVAAGQTVIRLAHAGPREASVFLPETVRPKIGSSARATLFAKSGAIPVWLRQLSDAADPLTRTFEAKYVLEGSGANAPLGATVTIQLAPENAGTLLAVPSTAITDRGNGPGVWILNRDKSTVSFRPVHITAVGDENTYLSSGVRPSDEVVALGAHLLREGQQVRIKEREVATR